MSPSGQPLLPERASMPLWIKARSERERFWGNKVFLRGIVEFSSYCRQNCLYCGLRRDNRTLVRYRLDADTVFACAVQIKALAFGTIVLQSGEDPDYPARELAELVARIKGELGLAVTLSVGERESSDYAMWRKAGADRYLLKAESMDKALYAKLRPGNKLVRRLDTLKLLRDLGYESGSGLIAGLPGEDNDGLERNIQALADLAPDMFSISPFQPHPDTPLGSEPPCMPEMALLAMARARLHLPHTHIPVTSALSLAGEEARLIGLEVGNVLMPSLTPEAVRRAYDIYPGKNAAGDDPFKRAGDMKNSLILAGFELPSGPGGAQSGVF
ncbi:[FeFe] hydrogenase H-cluster radical SAM maturase HydE [Desulfovibrio sp. OttesenSCG-928-M16]|nr:[FeFe] hydrogenase H-cluster radical SAM maturase HydE [Desulfovibrio sp. OttesenSCG-928-M16]